MDDANKKEPAVVSELQITADDDSATQPLYDCWNVIGVEGNGTCRELAKFIHCRNCSVYSAAGIQLLDRPLPREYRREWTEHFAREKKLGTQSRISIVIFRIASEWLALPTSAFQEIAEHRVMHRLPHRRGKLALGLVSIRGELTICASLARLLGLEHDTRYERKARSVYDRLLVTHWSGGRLAFPVDEVHGIHRYRLNELSEAPATVARSTLTYTQGILKWCDCSVGILNADTVFAAMNHNLS